MEAYENLNHKQQVAYNISGQLYGAIRRRTSKTEYNRTGPL